MLWIDNAGTQVTVQNCRFYRSSVYAIRFSVNTYGINASVLDNVFENCGNGILIEGNALTQATVQNNTMTSCGNTAIRIVGTGSTQATVQNNVLTGCSGTGIHISGTTASSQITGNTLQGGGTAIVSENCSPVIQNNTLTGNSGYPFQHIGQAYPVYSGNTLSANVLKVVAVNGSITANTTWQNIQGLNMPYLITDDLNVNSGVTLTIDPGVVVKFQYQSNGYSKRRMLVYGTLTAQGTSGSPIVFTSERDDAQGGDTNGDGGGTTPNNGDWGYVRIMSTGAATVEHCRFWYGGYRDPSEHQMLWIEAPSIAVRRSIFHRAAVAAVNYSSSAAYANFLLSACSFQDCPTGIKYAGSTAAGSSGRISGNEFQNGSVGVDVSRVGLSLGIQWNNFSSLTSYGVRNTDASKDAPAQANWWGHASGPSGAGSGSGVPVSTYVDFSNWWTSPSQTSAGVWNVLAQRRGDSMLVDVYYDLVGDAGSHYRVTLAASTTGGEPYTIPPSSSAVSGAVGSGVSPGNSLHILWDAAAGGGGPFTGTMRVKITADLE